MIRADKLLEVRRIEFLRFVDDYIIFGQSEDDVHAAVHDLNKILLDNEGLTLNRTKTRIYPSNWYSQTSVFAGSNPNLPQKEREKREFFKVHLRYDPYSETAEEDYESLKLAVKKHDILGLLAYEIEKHPIDIYTVRQLIKAVVFMDHDEKTDAIFKLSGHLPKLAPVFTTLAKTFVRIRDDIRTDTANKFFAEIRRLIETRLPLIGASGTLAFAIRVLAVDPNPLAEATLQDIFNQPEITPIVEREVILAMGRRNANSWISNLRSRFSSIGSPWSKRALLASSYILGDEGKHWRNSAKKTLGEHDKLLLDWIAEKNNGESWQFPV